jgi:hypothetical protein
MSQVLAQQVVLAYVFQLFVNGTAHARDTPFDDITKVLVVDPVVRSRNCSLRSFRLELVLTVPAIERSK